MYKQKQLTTSILRLDWDMDAHEDSHQQLPSMPWLMSSEDVPSLNIDGRELSFCEKLIIVL